LLEPVPMPLMLLLLLAYAFVSNVALAVVPHEPIVIWYGPRLGVWLTASVATLGTTAAAWVDHRLFVPLVRRLQAGRAAAGRMHRWFARAPFAILALSGLTPLPLFPFKALAFTARYPRGRYVAAIALGRLPRYLLLAWLGLAIPIPAWLLTTLFVLLLIPSLRMLLWPRQPAN
jgi:membrane protein YqaA with SNARE-associated domain